MLTPLSKGLTCASPRARCATITKRRDRDQGHSRDIGKWVTAFVGKAVERTQGHLAMGVRNVESNVSQPSVVRRKVPIAPGTGQSQIAK